MTLIKVCGIRSVTEGQAALAAGASHLGFVFWPRSKRAILPEHAAPIIQALRRESLDWSAVGVFVDPVPEDAADAARVCGLDMIQLSGHEPASTVAAMPLPTLKALHVRPGSEKEAIHIVEHDTLGADTYLLDTHSEALPGGTGRSFDWPALKSVGRRCLVAGGLRPDNVAAALAMLSPLGVDVSSGVEYPSGGKDPRLIRAFVEAVKTYDKHST